MNPKKQSKKTAGTKPKTSNKAALKIEKRSLKKSDVDPIKESKLHDQIISRKKVLFTEIDDEITGIYDKLKQYKMKNIYIVIPKRAILFQSIVNLRILRRKAEDLNKNVYIITNDQNGMHLAQRAGFTVFDKLEGNEHPSLVSGELLDDKLKITPLEASINTFEDATPTRLKTKKISIAELIRRSKKKFIGTTKRRMVSNNKKKKKEKNKYVLISPNRQALTILITITVLVLIAITYIALPGATLYLTPKSNTISVSANVTLADADKNSAYLDTHPTNVIPSFPVTFTIEKTITYYTTGNKFEGRNAQGTITIINTSNREWPLIEQTRFQSDEGLVFRIQQDVIVPPSTLSGPGKLDAFVVADEVDAYGQIVGDRGNIGPSHFFLPGLSEDNRKKIAAESSENFTGGQTITHKMISAEDVEMAEGKIKSELINSAEEELKKEVLRMNQERNIELALLVGDKGAIKIGEPQLFVPDGLEGQMLDQFDVSGRVYVSGIAYNHNELENILRNKLKMSRSPEKKLIKIDSESLTYRLIPIEAGEDTTRQKITATIKGIEQYEISPDRENGRRLIENITEHIIGKSVEEAKIYIQQLPAINKVEINSWPAWSPNLPSVPDNIKVEIVQE